MKPIYAVLILGIAMLLGAHWASNGSPELLARQFFGGALFLFIAWGGVI